MRKAFLPDEKGRMRERRGVDGGERGRPSRREGLPDHSRVSAIFIFVMSFRL